LNFHTSACEKLIDASAEAKSNIKSKFMSTSAGIQKITWKKMEALQSVYQV
jgi:hypothetical protein